MPLPGWACERGRARRTCTQNSTGKTPGRAAPPPPAAAAGGRYLGPAAKQEQPAAHGQRPRHRARRQVPEGRRHGVLATPTRGTWSPAQQRRELRLGDGREVGVWESLRRPPSSPDPQTHGRQRPRRREGTSDTGPRPGSPHCQQHRGGGGPHGVLIPGPDGDVSLSVQSQSTKASEELCPRAPGGLGVLLVWLRPAPHVPQPSGWRRE